MKPSALILGLFLLAAFPAAAQERISDFEELDLEELLDVEFVGTDAPNGVDYGGERVGRRITLFVRGEI